MRVNLFGAPHSGKTTLAHKICAYLKENHVECEYVRESAKKWAYQKRIPKGFAQLRFTANQIGKEEDFFYFGVPVIISDSPILLASVYAEYYNSTCQQQILEICKEYEASHPSINIMCKIKEEAYKKDGRFQDLKQAKKLEEKIIDVAWEYTDITEWETKENLLPWILEQCHQYIQKN